ncbi:MAG: hypothetical protein GC184_14735 [Rhizobiales bacterium]|nr:hypothetical protein [Hyphomicrobiales bacterium]
MKSPDEIAPFDEIRNLVGAETAAKLSAVFGGRRLYVPRNPGPHHPLAAAVGLEAARHIAREFGSARLDIPLAPGKRARIIAMRAEKISVADIAKALLCTERHVYYVLADNSSDARQDDLFSHKG